MHNQNAYGAALKEADGLPALPAKRRLSASSWQTVWTLQMENSLRAPETVDNFVRQYNDDRCVFGAKPRTSTRLCLSLTAVEMEDYDMAIEMFRLIRALEAQYGPVAQIEDRAVDQWSMYQA